MANILNAQLVPNVLTAAPNDYYASVINNGSINPEGLIGLIIKDGIELNPATLLDVITRYNAKAAEQAAQGVNVNTGLVYLRPVVKGAFYDRTWNAATNPVQIATTQGSAIRKAAADTTVRILGVKSDLLEILSVTDLATQLTDGTLTRGRNAELRGSHIKIAGDSDTTGVSFRNINTGEEIKLTAADIVLNEPSRLLLLIPDTLADGDYELSVTTQFSPGGKLLKEPRRASLPIPVSIA
ncbi:hypothetical protein FACS189430_07420 [Bacteroidia bacterium]|nr:hypothetical protein FACS189430_07420 [Bacteroidia bacterium]